MSIYAMSDLHGCKEEFDQMLKEISFSEYDELYIIGDICDRGNEPISLLLEIMEHPNMHVVLGNHDAWFSQYIDALIEEKTKPNSLQMTSDFFSWLHHNGGYTTLDQFLELDLPRCYDIKVYLEQLPTYQEIQIGKTNYLLVHAGLGQYAIPGITLASIPIQTLIWSHIGLDDNPFKDKTMVVGHIPTFIYGKQYDGQIIHRQQANLIHIDCGCVYGRTLGCIRLNDQQTFYVPSSYPYLKYFYE